MREERAGAGDHCLEHLACLDWNHVELQRDAGEVEQRGDRAEGDREER
jgi:hypothetical protein